VRVLGHGDPRRAPPRDGLRLRPAGPAVATRGPAAAAPHARTPIASYSLRVTPEKHFLNWQRDPYGNWVARFVFPEPTRELSFTIDLVEARRFTRFWGHGHTPGPMRIAPEPPNPSYPFTLDLRRAPR
jgi:hypothetical protein